jgi:polyisoprenoid-binding protein YceI
MITRRTATAALCFLAAAAPIASAQQGKPALSPDQIVQTMPIDIPEVISGGGWQAEGVNGVYRAVVVITPAASGSAAARVYIQWIGLKADGSAPQIIKSTPLPGLDQITNAQLSIDAEKDNEATFVVTSYDSKTQKPQFAAFKATLPGDVKPAQLPAEFSQGQVPAAKKP